MLQNWVLGKQTTDWMRKYWLLAQKEIPPVEEDSALDGGSETLAQIQYSLSVVVTGKNKVKKHRSSISVNPHILGSESPLSFIIDAKLRNGPFLLLNDSIPLSIKITKLGDSRCNILLSAFQTMLVEMTHAEVQGTSESSTSTWIVQSMANVNYPIGLEDAPGDSMVNLNDIIWVNNRLPPEVTSSFEVCNIKRTYKLHLRLAFLVGDSKSSEISNFPSML
ncbi:hypothetical protein N7491_001707 [Penicillium cf. griseofulvum]|nr:hypothetical protein N7491_001707 [Penicillium cf. griseofulvum]